MTTWKTLPQPSNASRLNRIQPQLPTEAREVDTTFTFRIQSEFPVYLASGNLAVIISGFTQGGL